jgi:hypothetical protein
MTSNVDQETDALDIDPIWTTSRTARQIYALGQVEKACKFMTTQLRSGVLTKKTNIGHHSLTLLGRIIHLTAHVASDGWTRRQSAAGRRKVGTVRFGS